MKPKTHRTPPNRCPDVAQTACGNAWERPAVTVANPETESCRPKDAKPRTPDGRAREESTESTRRRRNKFPFTDRRIERLKPEGQRLCYYDTKCPGLELRVSPTGYKVFSFVTHGGRRQRLGQFPPLTVQIAREVALEKRLCVELGINPVQRETLGELWKKYRQDMIDRDCARSSVKLFERCFRHLEPWKEKRLEQITPDMVLDLLAKLKKLAWYGLAKNLVKLLRAMVNFAIRRGWTGRSPIAGIGLPKTRTRTRFIEPHELHGFIATLERNEDVFSDLILTALFTGARRSEVERARWADIDLERRRWRFLGKGERARTVYLSDYVLEILRRRRRDATPKARYVFENPFTDRPLGWVRRAMYRAEMAARGLPIDTPYLSVKNQFSMHTLRHSFITYGLQAGVPLQVVQKMAGHTSDPRVTVAVYAHSTEEWEREGFQKISDYIRKLARDAKPRASGKGRVSSPKLPPPEIEPSGKSASLVAQKTAYVKYFRKRYLHEKAAGYEEVSIPERERVGS